MPAAPHFDVLEMWCPANLEATRRRWADRVSLRVDGRQPYAGGKAVVREVAQERRPRGHLPQARQHVPDEMPRMGPACAAVRSAQRDEVAHTTGAVQPLNVVPSDETALRVAHEIDSLAPVIASELFDPRGHDASQLLYRPRVEAAEEPAEFDAMSAVSQPTESSCQPGDDTRCSEEAMHQQDRPLTAT